MSDRIEKFLPGYRCGSCGFEDCKKFAKSLLESKADIDSCPFLQHDMFKEEREKIKELIATKKSVEEERIISLLDKHECDFVLSPLGGEESCREFLLPIGLEKPSNISKGSCVKWRPLGCPIVHFGEVFETHPLLGVYPKGPRFAEGKEVIDLGVILFLAFEGKVTSGRVPKVGETVVFIPDYCMMQKSHSGVIVEVIDNRVRVERVDLQVWNKADKF